MRMASGTGERGEDVVRFGLDAVGVRFAALSFYFFGPLTFTNPNIQSLRR